MKTLITFILSMAMFTANAQCITSTCSPCLKPDGVSAVLDGSVLWVGWNSGFCSKGIVPVVNGVEYPPLTGVAWHPAVSGGIVNGFFATANQNICVVIRNYCEAYPCPGATFEDSDPVCVTAPANLVDCKCPSGKYKITKPTQNGFQQRCVDRLQCIRFIDQNGWSSSCDCL